MALGASEEACAADRPVWPRPACATRSWNPGLAGPRSGVEVGVETETKNTVPLWLAVAITVVVSLPFGLWLKEWSVPLWAAFIVWAEYFVFGGKPAGLKIMVPSYILGVIGAVLVLILMVEMQKLLPDPQLVSATDVALTSCGSGRSFCISTMRIRTRTAPMTPRMYDGTMIFSPAGFPPKTKYSAQTMNAAQRGTLHSL